MISVLCRYEDLKQQLAIAQLQAEMEADEAELARAAAAVARLTAPTPPSTSGSSNSPRDAVTSRTAGTAAAAAAAGGSTQQQNFTGQLGDGEVGDDGTYGAAVAAGGVGQGVGQREVGEEDEDLAGPAAAKVKFLKEQVQELRENVHTGLTDDEDEGAAALHAKKKKV